MCSTKKKGKPWKKFCDQMIIFNFDQTNKVVQFKDSYMKPTFYISILVNNFIIFLCSVQITIWIWHKSCALLVFLRICTEYK